MYGFYSLGGRGMRKGWLKATILSLGILLASGCGTKQEVDDYATNQGYEDSVSTKQTGISDKKQTDTEG